MNKYHNVEEVAELIQIHPKTVRRYIREGKLQATKVGKAWRIPDDALHSFVEEEENSQKTKKRKRITVSTVIDIDVEDMNEAMGIVNSMNAILSSKTPEYGKATMNVQYIEEESKVRIMLWGTLKFTEAMLSSLSISTE